MSEQTSIEGPSPWTERASGPPALWYVYLAAMICATFFSNTATSFFHGFLDGILLREGGLAQPLAWYGLVTGCAAGLIWGAIFYWARQLRLVIVVPIIALFSVLSLAAAFYDLVGVSGDFAEELEVLRALALPTAMHVATFWLVFLAIAIPPRKAGRRAA
ncbi:MAG: hypothetical protein RKE49_04810 [Oceanicaulis sp.]